MGLMGNWLMLWLILFGAAVPSCHACCSESLQEVTLEEILALAAVGNTTVRRAEATQAFKDAEWLIARSAFEWGSRVSAVAERWTVPGQVTGRVATSRWTRSYDLAIGKTLPVGVRLEPFLRGSLTSDVAGAAGLSSAIGGISLRLPLSQLGRSNPAALHAQSAAQEARATELLRLHVLSEQLRDAASVYWDAVEAAMREEILFSAETRAAELLQMIRRLARAGERPRAEIQQMEAYLADRIAARIASEHQRFISVERLAILLGSRGHLIAQRPLRRWLPEAVPVEKLGSTESAPEHRWDIRAAKEELVAASGYLRGARSVARRQVNLELSSLHAISGSSVDPLSPGTTGVSVGLALSQSVPNRTGMGLIAQRLSLLEQQRLRVEALVQQTAADVRIARDALETAAREVQSAGVALEAHRLSVEQETARLANGFATVLDVTIAEERLTSAELSVLAARARLARALVRDAHERAQIVQTESESARERAARMVRQ